MNNIYCICDFETTGLNPDTDWPIEIGCIFTDENFNELERFESLIYAPASNYEKGSKLAWRSQYEDAYKVHNIDVVDVLSAPPAFVVAAKLIDVVQKYKHQQKKVILISDNIRFDWEFMGKCLNNDPENIFHYAGWDVNLAFELAGIDKRSKEKKHRAIADCEHLLGLLRQVERKQK